MSIHNINPEVRREIEKQINKNYGAVVSTITKHFGVSSLEHVQMVARNSFDEARNEWTAYGIPDNPEQIIWNSIVDSSNKLFCRKVNYLQSINPEKKVNLNELHFDYPAEDEAVKNQLELLFAAFDRSISYDIRKYLLLDIICGFHVSSLARIFGKNEKLLYNEIYSEKKKIINGRARLRIPSGKLAGDLTGDVLELLKVIFQKGYNCNNKDKTLFPSLCYSAVNLCRLLTLNSSTDTPEANALLSWMLFNASRINAMQDEKGNLLTLREQNRSMWESEMIEEGLFHLERSATGTEVSRTHLEAGVSAVHSLARDYESTNWDQIIFLYDNYLEYNQCPSVELERAIAISKQKGPQEGIYAINSIKKLNSLDTDDLLYSTLGNLNLQLHKYETAISNFRRAFDLTSHSFDRSFYSKKIQICQQRIDMSKRYSQSLSF